MKAKIMLMLAILMLAITLSPSALSQADDDMAPDFAGSDAYPDVMNIGSPGIFSAAFEADNDTSVTLYVCRDVSCLNCGIFPDKSGCFCYNENPQASGLINCTYTPIESDTESSYYIKLMNISGGVNHQTVGNPGTDTASFRINHRPYASSVYISYDTPIPTNSSILTCNYTYNDPESDSEMTNMTGYSWFVQDNGTGQYVRVPGETGQTLLSDHFEKWDSVKCNANVTDAYLLSSRNGTNSTRLNITESIPTISNLRIINNSPNVFLNWTATFFDLDLDPIIVTAVRWYRDGVYIPTFDDTNVSPASTAIGQTWQVEIHFQDDTGTNGSAANSTMIKIQEGGPSLYFINTSAQIENATLATDNVTFWINWTHDNYSMESVNIFICNESGATAVGCPYGSKTYCSLTDVMTSPTECNYTVRHTDNYTMGFYGMICDNATICTLEYVGEFYRFNDTTSPNMTVSFDWDNISANTTFMFNFNLTDNYNVSPRNIYINVSNRTNSTYHTVFNATRIGENWTMGENITCSGNLTDQNCSALINLSNGRYNATFWVNDSYGNLYLRTYSFTIDSIVPNIENAGNGFVNAGGVFVISDFAPNKHIFANWSNLTGTLSGIHHYEFALGKGENYGEQDWDSLINWTDVGLATQVNFTANMLAGESYFFHIRAINNGGAVSNVTTTGGMIFEDNTPPICQIVYDYAPHSINWTNSLNTLTAWWNFTENDTEIVEYEIAIGNATPPIQGNPPLVGFENILPRTSTALSSYTGSTLSLVENRTYYFSVRARNQYNAWSSWCYSDGMTVDVDDPRNGSLTYPEGYVAYSNITIIANPGVDDLSGLDLNNDVRLLYAAAPISPIDYTCPAFSAFTPAPQGPPYNPMGTLFNTTPGYCYKFRLIVTDRAGNEKTYYSMQDSMDDWTVVSDITPPVNFNVYDTGHKTYVGTELEANWTLSSDLETGISHYSYAIYKKSENNGSMILEYDWVNVSASTNSVIRTDLTLEDEVQYYFYVKAVNRVGIESAPMMSNGIIYADLSPPGRVIFQTVENNTFIAGHYFDTVNDGNTTVTAYNEDWDLGRCIYSETDTGYYELADSTNICNITGPGGDRNITCNVSSTTEGRKSYYIYCRDTNGNNQFNGQTPEIPLEINWVNDWSPPVININSPLNNQIVGGIVDIDTTIYDIGVGVISEASLQIINWSGTVVENATLVSPYNYTWDALNGSYNGTFKLVITANDTLGRESNASINFTIDNGRPWIDINLYGFYNDSFITDITAQLFTNMSFTITNSTGHDYVYNSTNFTNMTNYHEMHDYINISDPITWSEGIYTIYAEATDNISQNANTTAEFVVDYTAPRLENLSNTSTAYATNEFVYLNVTVVDANTVTSVAIMINDSGRWVNYTWTNGSLSNNLTKVGTMYKLDFQVPSLWNNKTHAWMARATDSAGNSNETPVFNFTVYNTWPIFQGSDANMDFGEDQTHVEIMPFFDLDMDNLTFNVSNSTNIFIVYINHTAKQVWFRSTPDWYGQENITINASDPYGGWNYTEMNVTVYNINDAPVHNTSNPVRSISFIEDSYNDSMNLTEHFYDIDNTTLTYGYLGTIPSDVSINTSQEIINFSSSNDYFGVFYINMTASDGIYTTPSRLIAVTVINVNDAPELGPAQNYTVNETRLLSVTFNASDMDSTSFNVSVNDTRWVQQSDNITYTWQTNLTDSGNYSINVTVSDFEGLSVWHVFNVTVINMSDFDSDGIPDVYDPDMDGDGISEPGDRIIGNISHIRTNIPNLQLYINGYQGINSVSAGEHLIELRNSSIINLSNMFMSVNHSFTGSSILDLRNVEIYLRNSTIDTPVLSMSGWGLPNKTLYLQPRDLSINSICIKDNDTIGLNISNVTALCNNSDEQMVICDSNYYGEYQCKNFTSINGSVYAVSGLNHSLIVQQDGCTDKDGDGYGVGGLCAGTDPADDDPSIYTGAPCTFDACFSGSTIDASGTCSGGSNTCGGGGSSRSGGSSGFIRIAEPEGNLSCVERWVCTTYSNCTKDGYQTRSCYDANTCGTIVTPENTRRLCEYSPLIVDKPSCYDGAQNQDEIGIDCGGSCPPCPTCFDGYQNQGEFGIDCGGPCDACPEIAQPSPIIVEIEKYKKWLIPALILLIIAAIIAVFMYRRGAVLEEKEVEDFWVKEHAGNILYYRKFKQKVFDKLVQLRIYVRNQMIAGKKPEEIKKELLKMGWKETVVQESFMLNKLVSLELYVKEELHNGVARDKIKSDLIAAGWHESSIEAIFMLNTLVQVELYIRKKVQKGMNPEDLKKNLMQAGWKKETVDQLFELNILLDLEIYLNRQLSSGMNEKEVTDKLIELGWSKDVVEEAIMFCKLTI